MISLWWSIAGSNRWPRRCQRRALPAELMPHKALFAKSVAGKQKANYSEILLKNSAFCVKFLKIWWIWQTGRDLNPRKLALYTRSRRAPSTTRTPVYKKFKQNLTIFSKINQNCSKIMYNFNLFLQNSQRKLAKAKPCSLKCGSVAQLVEHHLDMVVVVGSSPIGATIYLYLNFLSFSNLAFKWLYIKL